MKANRRGFLALLGVGTASAPLAAKAALDKQISEQVRIFSSEGFCAGSLGLASGECPPMADGPSNIPYSTRFINVADYVKMFGLPEFADQQFRDSSKYVHALDPDIACKRSWSMSVKIQEQRQRNYDRAIERLHTQGWQYKKRSAISKVLGFDWPW